jgi:RNA polymerase sigma-70 factor (ECF subfamily)
VLEAQIIQFPLSARQRSEKSMAQREIQRRRARDRPGCDLSHRLHHPRDRGMNVETADAILGFEAGDREDPAAPRPNHAARQCRKKIGPVVMEAFPFAGSAANGCRPRS